MLKSCRYCGKVVDKNHQCANKPKPIYARTESEQGRYTHEWNNKSLEIKQRSLFLCAMCLDKGIYNYNELETHHIIKLRDRPDLLLDDSNLICLCSTCHKAVEHAPQHIVYLQGLARVRDTT